MTWQASQSSNSLKPATVARSVLANIVAEYSEHSCSIRYLTLNLPQNDIGSHVGLYMHVFIDMHIHMYLYVYTCMHTCVCVCMYVCIYIYTERERPVRIRGVFFRGKCELFRAVSKIIY